MGEFADLDDRFRSRWGQEYALFTLRLRRATSWGRRGDEEEEKDSPDHDVAFILYWVAFNALYAEDTADYSDGKEREDRQAYLNKVVLWDESQSIIAALRSNSKDVRELLDNQFIFRDFWKYQNEVPGFENWREALDRDRRNVEAALPQNDVLTVLRILFERLYELRNQLVHGGATWRSKVNREQVTTGAKLMRLILSLFVELMLAKASDANKDDKRVWGKPYYPVVNKPDDWA